MPEPGFSFREGTASDLPETFALSRRAMHELRVRQGVLRPEDAPTDADIRSHWLRRRSLIEFTAAQPDGRYWICENGDGEGPIGYARVVRFGGMDQLTDVMVRPSHQHRGIGRQLLERCWPGDPSPDLGRVVVASGTPADLSLYTSFGAMPVAGHWQLRHRTEDYVHARTLEIDASEPGVHALEPGRAVAEWKRLEPSALAQERPLLHEFFGRDRVCLATLDDGEVTALCWIGDEGEIGPAVSRSTEELAPVVLAALDRVANAREPEFLSLYCTTIAWWLLKRLRGLGFCVEEPAWIMCSVPLPGLDRYVPTKPALLL